MQFSTKLFYNQKIKTVGISSPPPRQAHVRLTAYCMRFAHAFKILNINYEYRF